MSKFIKILIFYIFTVTIKASNGQWPEYNWTSNQSKNLYNYILKVSPDVCELNEDVRNAVQRFNPQQKQIVQGLMDSLGLGIRRRLATDAEMLLQPAEIASINKNKLKQLFELFGLNYSSQVCSKDAKYRLKTLVSSLSPSEQSGVKLMFSNLQKQMQNVLPKIFSQAFAENSDFLKILDQNDPTVMRTIGTILGQFYANTTMIYSQKK